MEKTIHEVIQESLKGRLMKCPCEKDSLTYLLSGDCYYTTNMRGSPEWKFIAYDLDRGEESHLLLNQLLSCGLGNFREISPLELTSSQANVLANYEREQMKKDRADARVEDQAFKETKK